MKTLLLAGALATLTLGAGPALAAEPLTPEKKADIERLIDTTGAMGVGRQLSTAMIGQIIVSGRMFAMYLNDHHGDGRVALWCRAPLGAQEILVGRDPVRFFVPPYVGHKGWVGVRLDRRLGWRAVADVLTDAYRMSAPVRLARRLPGQE